MTSKNAIDINLLNGNQFPVTIEYSSKNGIYCVYLTPISVREVIRLLPEDTFLIFNVDTNESDGGSLDNTCENYSSFLKVFDGETLLMTRQQVIELLNNVDHYNFHLISVREDIDIDSVIQIIDISDKWNVATVIDKTNSEIFISSHDDCYLYIETNDEKLAEQLVALQIEALVNTVSTSMSELKADIQELIATRPFSVVIPRTFKENSEEITWKILEGSFKNFVHGESLVPSGKLTYSKGNGKIIAVTYSIS